NPIERLWKVMNEHVRNNVVFDSLNTFRENIEHFFVSTIPEIKHRLRSRITDNFQTFNTGFSS
ncbi:MAG: IS630 family transposase, partial [Gallionella sp.]|nr:IS630 family transposase [Gallionella sp.]